MMKAIPLIYEGPLDTLPTDVFNTVKITLPAQLDANLCWEDAQKVARSIIEKGLNLVWEIDLGLFAHLPLPLSDTTQYKSLHLALDHFFETLWKEFQEHTVGAILFKGPLDLTSKWMWNPDQQVNLTHYMEDAFSTPQSFYNQSGIACTDFSKIQPKELLHSEFGQNVLRFFCLAAALDYIEILAARFPSDLLPYVLFDAQHLKSKMHIYQLLDHEVFDYIQLGLKNVTSPHPHAIGWESLGYPNGFIGKKYQESQKGKLLECKRGLLVPSKALYDPKKQLFYDTLFEELSQQEPMRYLGERHLTMDWGGLDTLVVFELEGASLRKLEGFIAAGGEVVTVRSPLGLSQETSLNAFKKQMEIS